MSRKTLAIWYSYFLHYMEINTSRKCVKNCVPEEKNADSIEEHCIVKIGQVALSAVVHIQNVCCLVVTLCERGGYKMTKHHACKVNVLAVRTTEPFVLR